MVWHEYGHAVQDDQVPELRHQPRGWRSIGEGFGDYLAVTMSQKSSPNTEKTPWACVMDWDSTSYTSDEPHCLRRTDLTLDLPRPPQRRDPRRPGRSGRARCGG